MKYIYLCFTLVLLASRGQAQEKQPPRNIVGIPVDSRLGMWPAPEYFELSKGFTNRLPATDEAPVALPVDESLRPKFDIRLLALITKPTIFTKLKRGETDFNNDEDRDFISWRSFGQAGRSLPNWFDGSGKVQFRKIAFHPNEQKVFFRSTGMGFEATGYFPLILDLTYWAPSRFKGRESASTNLYLKFGRKNLLIRDGELHLVLTPGTPASAARVGSIFKLCDVVDAINRAGENVKPEMESRLSDGLEKLYGSVFIIKQVRREGNLFKIEGITYIDPTKNLKPKTEVFVDYGNYDYTLYVSEHTMYIRTRFFSDITLAGGASAHERLYTKSPPYLIPDAFYTE